MGVLTAETMYTDGIGGGAMVILCLCWYSCVEKTNVKVAEVLRNTELVVTRCISATNFKFLGQARELSGFPKQARLAEGQKLAELSRGLGELCSCPRF